MEKSPKKIYQKPRVTKISLDAKTAVLAVCKTSGKFGPGRTGCETFLGDPCRDAGS
jgi:hypothetical protein